MVIEDEGRAGPGRRWLWLVVVAALLLGALGVGLGVLRRGGGDVDLRGVRLGLTAADTRARFQAPGAGSWSSEAGSEPSLRWTANQAGAPVREAVFEFHQGMLVAVRLKLDPASPEASGPQLEVTPARVVSRSQPAPGEATVTVISRSCPAHADEVRRLLGGAGRLAGATSGGPGVVRITTERIYRSSTGGRLQGRSCAIGHSNQSARVKTL